jgi:hypothetical protein
MSLTLRTAKSCGGRGFPLLKKLKGRVIKFSKIISDLWSQGAQKRPQNLTPPQKKKKCHISSQFCIKNPLPTKRNSIFFPVIHKIYKILRKKFSTPAAKFWGALFSNFKGVLSPLPSARVWSWNTSKFNFNSLFWWKHLSLHPDRECGHHLVRKLKKSI